MWDCGCVSFICCLIKICTKFCKWHKHWPFRMETYIRNWTSWNKPLIPFAVTDFVATNSSLGQLWVSAIRWPFILINGYLTLNLITSINSYALRMSNARILTILLAFACINSIWTNKIEHCHFTTLKANSIHFTRISSVQMQCIHFLAEQ